MARGEYCIMAYWLEIGSDNVVKNCVKTPDNVNENWCIKNLGFPSGGISWMEQTTSRGGGIGDTYVSANDWFKKNKPINNIKRKIFNRFSLCIIGPCCSLLLFRQLRGFRFLLTTNLFAC